ncbi:MAG: RNA polymerase sigma factor RpoD/SigA [Cyclobacteriaceae bacterium]
MQQITMSNKITRLDCDSLGKYFKDISKQHLLTPDEEITLVRKIRSGDKFAKDKLIRANLRFVVSVAKHYQNGPVPLSDLISEGNIGLIKAAERFDETRGFRFISYAVWWIRQSILAALDEQSRLIKVPSNKLSSMSRIRKVIDSWEKRHERPPTTPELAEMLNITEEEVVETIGSFSSEFSLDAPVGIDSESSMIDFIPNHEEDENEQPGQRQRVKNDVGKILSRLNDREKKIVKMAFGINYPSSYSLDEISEQVGISRERVRQIKEKALKKLSFHGVRKRIKALTAA